MPDATTCATAGCGKPVQVREWCRRHYQAWYRSQKFVNVEQFWSLADRSAGPDGCWLWNGATKDTGYGVYRARNAHRVAYEIATGRDLGSLHIDHVCHTINCVNPEHLRPVTAKQNMENLSGAHRDSKTGVRGVKYASGAYRATVRHNGRDYNVGRFPTLEAAAEAVRLKRLELYTHNEVDRIA